MNNSVLYQSRKWDTQATKRPMISPSVCQIIVLMKKYTTRHRTTVALLCTRVKEPDIDYYKKLTRVMHVSDKEISKWTTI